MLVESFDGLGVGFEGPQGTTNVRNPSDNTLAVGPDHIVQIVNSQTAIFTKKGRRFATTGRVLYGPVNTANFFRGFGGQCEATNNGDAVARYDQSAKRWLVVMPLFRRGPVRPDQPEVWKPSDKAYVSPPGMPGQPGAAMTLVQPPPPPPPDPSATGQRGRGQPGGRGQGPSGPYSMCYAISSSDDPMGSYFRYEFLRPLFPDYPRPAIWRDGYYVPTSTGDDVIEKHACVVERAKMLKGEPAREQCVVLDGVGFLNNADVDGTAMPPAGAPNIMMTAGGSQLKNVLEDDGVYTWRFAVDWKDASKTKVTGPDKIAVAPYHYLCDGQLKNCVPQRGTDRRLDSQGDKIMSRLVYRRLGSRESIVGVHSVNTTAGGGGVRWYEFRLDRKGNVSLHQQGTYAPDGLFRWMASPAIDRFGNIGIGYSFGGPTQFAGQRFAARLSSDPPGLSDRARGRYWSRARTSRRPCGGRTTRRRRLTRRMTARFGTLATTSRKARRATRAGSARFGCRVAADPRSHAVVVHLRRARHGTAHGRWRAAMGSYGSALCPRASSRHPRPTVC